MAQDKSYLTIGAGELFLGDCAAFLRAYEGLPFQSIIADPPYYQVLQSEHWDNMWENEAAYIEWSCGWVRLCMNALADDGLLFMFGQLGKREHVFLHLCSALAHEFQFHDMIIWDRVVGYNNRGDSFTPQYENILVLRKTKDSQPYFNKDAVRLPYEEAKIQSYLRDKRYKDKVAREAYLRKGKYATNILSVPSLKGSSKEKVGHPSQKPIELIEMLVKVSSREGDIVFDPFMGSGTTALACENLGRKWVGCEIEKGSDRLIKQRLQTRKENVTELFSDFDEVAVG